MSRRFVALMAALLLCADGFAQETTVVPPLVRVGGQILEAAGTSVEVIFGLYSQRDGGEVLWIETQNVDVDAAGSYTVHLGADPDHELPLDLFSRGEVRWLGVQASGQSEQPRVQISAVPYALKAADADTLGGLPLSAFVLAPTARGAGIAPATAAPAEQALTDAGTFDPASPGPIGSVTPDTGVFTALTANQTSWLGTGTSHNLMNTIATKAAPNPFCWPTKFWLYGADGTTVDDALAWGYNCSAAAGDPYLTFTLERNWFDGNRHQFEHYIQTNTGGLPWRPSFFAASTDQPSIALWQFLIGESVGGTSGFHVGTKDGTRLLRVQKGYSYIGNVNLNFDDGVQLTAPNVMRVRVGGKLLYEFNASAFRPWSAFANTVDIGSATQQFRTGYFGTSVRTPRLTGITDTTAVTNLNADMIDGRHASDFASRVTAPVSSGVSCTVGQWATDTDYFYVCVAADTWRRAALSSW